MAKIHILEQTVNGKSEIEDIYLDSKDAKKNFNRIVEEHTIDDYTPEVIGVWTEYGNEGSLDIVEDDWTVHLYSVDMMESRQKRVVNPYDPKDVAKMLSDFVNCCGHREDIAQLVDEIMRDHPTLLQAKMNIAFGMVARAAALKKKGFVDGRNEISFGIAEEMFDAMSTDDDGEDNKYHKLNMACPFI